MALQLLCRLDSDDLKTTRQALMDDAEDQQNAGLTRLRMWEDADDTTRLWILFEVNDRGKADGWLKRAVADTHGPTAAVTGSQAHFLRTA